MCRILRQGNQALVLMQLIRTTLPARTEAATLHAERKQVGQELHLGLSYQGVLVPFKVMAAMAIRLRPQGQVVGHHDHSARPSSCVSTLCLRSVHGAVQAQPGRMESALDFHRLEKLARTSGW